MLSIVTEADTDGEGAAAVDTQDVERQVIEIWKRVLNMEAVHSGSQFFDVSGDSLLAMRVAARIRQAFHIEFSARQVFRLRTPSRQAAAIAFLLQARTGSRDID